MPRSQSSNPARKASTKPMPFERIGAKMKAIVTRVVIGLEFLGLAAFAVILPVLWWSPKTWITLAGFPVGLGLVALGIFGRRAKKELGKVPWWCGPVGILFYLPWAVAAFYLRESPIP